MGYTFTGIDGGGQLGSALEQMSLFMEHFGNPAVFGGRWGSHLCMGMTSRDACENLVPSGPMEPIHGKHAVPLPAIVKNLSGAGHTEPGGYAISEFCASAGAHESGAAIGAEAFPLPGGRYVDVEDMIRLHAFMPNKPAPNRRCSECGKLGTHRVFFDMDDGQEFIVLGSTTLNQRPYARAKEWISIGVTPGSVVQQAQPVAQFLQELRDEPRVRWWYKAIAEVEYSHWHFTCKVDTNVDSTRQCSNMTPKWVHINALQKVQAMDVAEGWMEVNPNRMMVVYQRGFLTDGSNSDSPDVEHPPPVDDVVFVEKCLTWCKNKHHACWGNTFVPDVELVNSSD